MEKQEILEHIDAVVANHIKEENQRYDELKKDIEELNKSVQSLLEMWNQAKGVIFFLKWVVGVGGSVAAFVAFFKGAK